MPFHKLTAILALFTGAALLGAQEHHHADGAEALGGGHLGQVHFPIACAPGLQQSFEKGVALLQYIAAAAAFNPG